MEKKMISNARCFKNEENSFTELFSLLRKYEVLSQDFLSLAYNTEELHAIHQHIDNAMVVLLQGLQDVGNLMGIASQNKKKMMAELKTIGFFIAGLGNLTEALHVLRSDTNYMLQQHCKE